MAKKDIRTKYIKNLVADKDAMAKVLEESTKESLTSLLDETVNRSLRQMLAESDNDSYEEEVDTDKPEFDFDNQNNNSDDNIESKEFDEGGVNNVDLESGEDAGNCENGECDAEAEGGDVWDEVSDCMDSDGEYDLRGKDIKTVLKVIQNMETNDGLRIVKNDDETATVEVENGDGSGEDEFVIDITDDGDGAEPNEFEDEMSSDADNAVDGNDGMDTENGEEGMMDDIDLDNIENDDQGDNDEAEFELEIGDNDENPEDDMVNEGNVNLGYTDNYQKKSAMTMPTDKGEGEGDSRFDDGAPKGGANNKKRWVGHDGQNGGNPYSNKTKQPMTEETNECGANCGTNECGNIYEVELDGATNVPDMPVAETHTRGMARKHNSVGRKEVPNTNVQADEEDTRNIFVGADQKRNCSKNESQNRMSAIERQANAVLEENKQLKEIAAQIKQQLNEAVLINASLAKVIKLITENATSREEKINILNRFNKVKSLNECKNLYSQISGELKSSHAVNNNLLNKQLTEAKSQNKNMIVETNMLNQSEDLRQILDLNERLINLGK